jgi:hypothetical protein
MKGVFIENVVKSDKNSIPNRLIGLGIGIGYEGVGSPSVERVGSSSVEGMCSSSVEGVGSCSVLATCSAQANQ